jgi:hypothetical protein
MTSVVVLMEQRARASQARAAAARPGGQEKGQPSGGGQRRGLAHVDGRYLDELGDRATEQDHLGERRAGWAS